MTCPLAMIDASSSVQKIISTSFSFLPVVLMVDVVSRVQLQSLRLTETAKIRPKDHT